MQQIFYNNIYSSNTLDEHQPEYKNMKYGIKLLQRKLDNNRNKNKKLQIENDYEYDPNDSYLKNYKETSINKSIIKYDINFIFKELYNKYSILYFINNINHNYENKTFNNLDIQIEKIIIDCKENGWDGYDANPISSKTQINSKTLIKKLIINIPEYIVDNCDISPASDGSIVFEWRENSSKIFTISILEDQVIYIYINKIKKEKTTGKFEFIGIDNFLRTLINYV